MRQVFSKDFQQRLDVELGLSDVQSVNFTVDEIASTNILELNQQGRNLLPTLAKRKSGYPFTVKAHSNESFTKVE